MTPPGVGLWVCLDLFSASQGPWFVKSGVKFVCNTLHVTELQAEPLKRAVFTGSKNKPTWVKTHTTPGMTEKKILKLGVAPVATGQQKHEKLDHRDSVRLGPDVMPTVP